MALTHSLLSFLYKDPNNWTTTFLPYLIVDIVSNMKKLEEDIILTQDKKDIANKFFSALVALFLKVSRRKKATVKGKCTGSFMCQVGALFKALGILVWILGPESTVARIFISMKNVSMCKQSLQLKIFSGIMPQFTCCLLYTSPSPRDGLLSRMPSSA